MPHMPHSPKLTLSIQALDEVLSLSPTPYARGISSVARAVLSAIAESRNVDKEHEKMAERVSDVAVTCSNLSRGQPDSTIAKETSRYAGQVITSLEELVVAIKKRPARGFVGKILSRQSDKFSISLALERVEFSATMYSIKLSVANARLSDRETSNFLEFQKTMEANIERAQEAQLELLRTKLLEKSREKEEHSSFVQTLPPAPLIFYGRSEALNCLVDTIASSRSCVAILGPGGIGKTSLALSAVHHPKVVSVYGSRRIFLACETIEDADRLLAGICEIFNLTGRNVMQRLKRVCQIIGLEILFLLDNFETPWESRTQRQDVETILRQLTEIPNLSVVITMRGAERPLGVPWTRPFLEPLTPLDMKAAKHTFLAIADHAGDDLSLTELLVAVDCVPLAVTLLAAQAQNVDCATLLSDWKELKTSMITRGYDSRLSSLNVSIHLSIDSKRLQSNSDAKTLLKILSLLPDGLTQNELASVTPASFGRPQAVSILYQVSLAYKAADGRFRSLSPVREYVQAALPISLDDYSLVLGHYATLSKYALENCQSSRWIEMTDQVTPCISNIHSVLHYALNSVPERRESAIQAAIDISSLHNMTFIGSSVFLLTNCMKAVQTLQNIPLEAACLHARACCTATNLREKDLERSIELYRTCPKEKDGLILALTRLSGHYRECSEISRARIALDEALGLPSPTTPALVRSAILLEQSELLLWEGRMSSAIKASVEGLSIIDAVNHPLVAFSYYLAMANAYLAKDMYPQAVSTARKGLQLVQSSRFWRLGDMYAVLGLACLASSSLEESYQAFGTAYAIFAESGREMQMAMCQEHFALISIARRDYAAAESHFGLCGEIQVSKFNSFGLLCYMAEMELSRGNFSTAAAHCHEATNRARGLKRLGVMEIHAIIPLADVFLNTGQPVASLSHSVHGALISSRGNQSIYTASCIQRIGDPFYLLRNFDAAQACYQASLDIIYYLGNKRRIAECLLRLGLAEREMNKNSAVGREQAKFSTAARFFRQSGYELEAEYCDLVAEGRNISDNIDSENGTEDLPVLPLIPFFP